MQIKTFRAASVQEALGHIRNSLGPEASVLHIRELKSRQGRRIQSMIEVDATLDIAIPSRFATHGETGPPGSQLAPMADWTLTSRDSASATASVGDSRGWSQDGLNSATQESDVRDALPALSAFIRHLREQGVADEETQRIVRDLRQMCSHEQLGDEWALRVSAVQAVCRRLKTASGIDLKGQSPTVVVVVGPPGAGKTTSLAKIASTFQFEQKCNVGLLSMDSYRLGAVDQLLHFADRLSCPLQVVSSPDEIIDSISRLEPCDLILVDTPGASPGDDQQLAELDAIVAAAAPDFVELVVPTVSSPRYASECIAQYGSLHPNGIVLSKLDEAVDFGSWLSLLTRCEIPVSYLSAGRRVPENITKAHSRRLASKLIGYDLEEGQGKDASR